MLAFAAAGLINDVCCAQEADDKFGSLQEVVVTAQKRAEKLQDVPISISVVQGKELDSSSATGISEQLGRVPGLAVTTAQQGGGTVVTVRGVAPPFAYFNGSSTVGYYLDSVPFGLVKSGIAPDLDAYDLQRVEVLRGPQGVFYGADSLNGVVRVLTQDPDLNEFDFKMRTSGSYTQSGSANFRGDAAINAPIIDDVLGARLVLGYEDLSGWINRPNKVDANSASLSNVRLKVDAKPTTDLSIGVSIWRSRDTYNDVSQGYTYNQNAETIAEPIENGFDTYGLKVAYQFQSFSVSSSTSYLSYKSFSIVDLGPSIDDMANGPLYGDLRSKVYSEEINLNSTGEGDWQWSAGGIYRHGKDHGVQSLPTMPDILPEPIGFTDASTSYAFFGQATRRLMEGLFDVSAGLRYFHDHVVDTTDPGIFESPPLVASFRNVSPRIAVNWHPDKNLTSYVSYSTGFRSGFGQGALTVLSDPDLPPVQPDKLSNYEFGVKGQTPGGLMVFDTSIYYIQWRDVQQAVNVFFNGVGVSANVNGASASGPGVDFALTLNPMAGLSLGINIGWNHLTLDQAVISGGLVYFDRGDRLVDSPEYVAGLNADYTFPLGGSGYHGKLSASGNFASHYYANNAEPTDVVRFQGQNLTTGRASFAVEAPRHWTASLYVENIGNYTGSPIPNNQSFPEAAFHEPDNLLQRIRPRTVGLQFEYRLNN